MGTDDAAIYVPAIKQIADPTLYPFGAEFFQTHAHLSVFATLIGQSARLTRLPIDAVILIWHCVGIFLLLLAAWQLLNACFYAETAKWGGVCLLAALFAVPVAGTALVLVDPYVTARTLSAPASLFAVVACLNRRPTQAILWLLLTLLIHPQMAIFATVLVVLLSVPLPAILPRFTLPLFPSLFDFSPARGPARDALMARTYFFVANWAWYEWVGVFAPLALIWLASRQSFASTKPPLQKLLRILPLFALCFTAFALVLSFSPRLENLARLQPMRAFHILYIVFFVLLGAWVGQVLLQHHRWRWLALFLPILIGMSIAHRETYPASGLIEWPSAGAGNSWADAFLWVRHNTPKDAIFALDPGHMQRAGADMHGFRAIAERSMLADAVKDSGAVSLFPQLADHWQQQVAAQLGIERFSLPGLVRLQTQFPVTWFLTASAPPQGLDCPYQQDGISICRLPTAPTAHQTPHPR